jgi:hypothetical protein
MTANISNMCLKYIQSSLSYQQKIACNRIFYKYGKFITNEDNDGIC